MEELGISYQQAKDLVAKYITDDITRYHCLESEAVMRGLAKYFGEDEEAWGIVGLLHDIDWCLTKNDTSQHCLKMVEIIKEAGGTDFLVETIQSHGYELDKRRTTRIQYALAAGETVTGLIVACALVQPDKKLASVGVPSVIKKFKNKAFAKNCRREIIMECEKLGLSLEEFVKIALSSMQGIASEIGL